MVSRVESGAVAPLLSVKVRERPSVTGGIAAVGATVAAGVPMATALASAAAAASVSLDAATVTVPSSAVTDVPSSISAIASDTATFTPRAAPTLTPPPLLVVVASCGRPGVFAPPTPG